MGMQPEQTSNLPTAATTATPDWAPLRTLLIGFPTRTDTWRENAIPAQKCLLSFISQLLQTTHETVTIIAPPSLPLPSQKLLNQFRHAHDAWKQRLRVVTLPMNDCWLRDTGPVFTRSVMGSEVLAKCFKFNAWGGCHGGCYEDYVDDSMMNKRLSQAFRIPIEDVDIVLEGGSLTSDGQGTIITTEQCLLHRNRNPQLSKPEIARVLREHLGARKIIWLPYGAAYDEDTDGHVDNMAVFARPGHVVLAYGGCAEQRSRSEAAARVLRGECDAKGRPLVVHAVPVPVLYRTPTEADGVRRVEGVMERTAGRICASYVNFFICGNRVFVPRFGVREDEQAKQVLVKVFGKGAVIMVNAREFVLAGGGLHCLTLGVPR